MPVMTRERDRDPTGSENRHRAKRMDDEVVFPVKAVWSASVPRCSAQLVLQFVSPRA